MNQMLWLFLGSASLAFGQGAVGDISTSHERTLVERQLSTLSAAGAPPLASPAIGLTTRDARAAVSQPATALPLPRPPLNPKAHREAVETIKAQYAAIRRFPDLGIRGSRLNSDYLALYSRYQRERPDYFKDPSWPVRLAEELAKAPAPK